MTEEMTKEQRDALYENILNTVRPEPKSMTDFLKTHEEMQADAKKLVDAHPVKKDMMSKLARFGADPKSQKNKEDFIKKNIHMPGADPENCHYCKHLVDYFEQDLKFEKDNLGTHRILEGDKRDHFRRQVDLIYGVFKFMKKNGEI